MAVIIASKGKLEKRFQDFFTASCNAMINLDIKNDI